MRRLNVFVIVFLQALFLHCAQGFGATNERVINVRDFGAKGDGKTGDTAAIQRAIDAAPDGSVIYFPAGTYLIDDTVRSPVSGFWVEKRNGLRFEGDGSLSIIRRNNIVKRNATLCTFRHCSDITITRLGFDNHAVERFGGVSFYDCKRVRIDKNHFFDSGPRPCTGFDRYAVAFSPEGPHEDIWFTENLVERLQVEIDHARRVHILNNRVIRPEHTAGIGWFSQKANAICEDYQIVGNVVIDAKNLAITALLDGPENLRKGCIIRRLLIADNIVVYKTLTPCIGGIMVGSRPEERIKGPGTTWDGVQIINNIVWFDEDLVWSDPAVPRPGHMLPGIRVVTASRDEKMRSVRLSGNQVVGHGKLSTWGIEIAYLKNSIIEGNSVSGAANGILIRDEFAGNLITNNTVTDISGIGFKLSNSGGNNAFLDNVGAAFQWITPKDSDTVSKSF